jgi:hypothetical protein
MRVRDCSGPNFPKLLVVESRKRRRVHVTHDRMSIHCDPVPVENWFDRHNLFYRLESGKVRDNIRSMVVTLLTHSNVPLCGFVDATGGKHLNEAEKMAIVMWEGTE